MQPSYNMKAFYKEKSQYSISATPPPLDTDTYNKVKIGLENKFKTMNEIM